MEDFELPLLEDSEDLLLPPWLFPPLVPAVDFCDLSEFWVAIIQNLWLMNEDCFNKIMPRKKRSPGNDAASRIIL